jgi:hypothetical protein
VLARTAPHAARNDHHARVGTGVPAGSALECLDVSTCDTSRRGRMSRQRRPIRPRATSLRGTVDRPFEALSLVTAFRLHVADPARHHGPDEHHDREDRSEKGVGPHQHAPRAAPTAAANLEIDRELATLLALKAVGMYGGDDIPPEVDEILRRAVPAVSIDTEPIFGSGIDSFRFSPDKDAVALVGADGSLGVWNLVTGARRFALRSPAVTCSFLIGCPDFFRIALSDDGSLLAAGDAEGARPRVGPRLRARGPHRLRSRRSAGRKAWRSCSSPGCHQPDERFLATGGGDGAIRLWDIVTGGSVEHPDGNGEESDRPSPALGLRAVAIVLRSRRNPLVHRWPAALRRGCRQRANARLVEGSVLACRGRGPIQVPPGIRPPNGTGPPDGYIFGMPEGSDVRDPAPRRGTRRGTRRYSNDRALSES